MLSHDGCLPSFPTKRITDTCSSGFFPTAIHDWCPSRGVPQEVGPISVPYVVTAEMCLPIGVLRDVTVKYARGCLYFDVAPLMCFQRGRI
jgi:hypothetical protein